jgi:ribonuclease-3
MTGRPPPRPRELIPNLEALERVIGVKFTNRDLLITALTHRSYLNEHRDERAAGAEHNERLEFLGDAVIEIVVTNHLYRALPNDEGHLTNMRAKLVSAQAMTPLGVRLGLGKYMRMSRGERQDFDKAGKSAQYMLANAVEALVGAIFLDRGYGVAELFIRHFIIPQLDQLKNMEVRDPKSLFQEVAQERLRITPEYRTLSESGPDHQKVFVVAVFLARRQVGTGTGASKSEAQVQAAHSGLVNEFQIRLAT